jgi:flagellar basal body-associated protein FliL
MAEKKPKEAKEEKPQQVESEAKTESGKAAPAKGKGGLFVWLILGAVIVAGSTGGFALSKLMGGTEPSANADANMAEQKPVSEDPLADYVGGAEGGGGGKEGEGKGKEGEGKGKEGAGGVIIGKESWIYDGMDPIVANLDEPGVTRYVRVSIILEISLKVDPHKGQVFLDEKKVLLQDWLTTYLAGLSLEDVRGSRNLNRIKREMQNQFNQLLFGQDKSYVDRVLFKEFAVQ